ncbi:MAG: sulfur oxidation c-type cytochrome SoxX [Gammaproteobacteria bacterium]|nr:sulfur oxidation c-type cytochrome SoxX [Gammaproteobacteria bacterium]MBU1480591.1 sulfur oxidation c-type cytochrome SoxX [Gammaproteobacteria bacterium]
MNAKLILGITAALSLTTALPVQAGTDLDAKTAAIIKRDFRDKGIAKVERLNQDELQAACSKYKDDVPVDMKVKLEDEQLKQIKWPADGILVGDWKAGEKLAQSGKGLTWSDKEGDPAGGNCYNCHQLSSTEIAYGTIGPSLLHYAKKKGGLEKAQRRAYGRIYNAKAYNACANMPRFGHIGILTEAQIKDLVALLVDPESPVNK